MSYPVLHYANKNDKLLALLSESNHFSSVIFCFDGCRRYKFMKEDLGILSASDLLLRNRGLLSLLNPSWSYHLYYLDNRFTYSIDGLCSKVLSRHGRLPCEGECHVFVSKRKHHIALLYSLSGEYTSIHRQLRQGTFCLKRKDFVEGYKPSHWQEICRLLSEVRETKRRHL